MGRRTNDRRRRVLYSTHLSDQTASTAASRREIERLREARRPTAAYGARVQRRLRGRWFSLVPVKRRSYTILASVVTAVTLLLCLAHYASNAWPALVYHPEIARPLRLDVPDSFGRWFMVAMLSTSAGIALMTYQLRRYRLDDYLGRYRLWRLVLIVLVIASVNALVGLVDWTGALLDVTFGKRVALTGGDWLRVVVGLGGAVLCLRMIAEMYRSRAAFVSMLVTCVALMIGQAAQWNVMEDDTLGPWTLVTSIPLIASTSIFIAMTGYLRMLYREVREIEDSVSLRERLDRMRLKIFTRSDAGESELDSQEIQPTRAERRQAAKEEKAAAAEAKRQETEQRKQAAANRKAERDAAKAETSDDDEATSGELKRGWFGRMRSKPAADSDDANPAGSVSEVADSFESDDRDDQHEPKAKRRWFGLRAAKFESGDTDSGDEIDSADQPSADENGEAAPKKRRFGLGLRSRRAERADADAGESGGEVQFEPAAENANGTADENAEDAPAKRRSGLGGWFGRKKADSADAESGNDADDQTASGSNHSSSQGDDEGDGEYIDPDSIDWNSLNKTEKRRIKKQLRRQDRAA
ncbi:ICP22 family protein [Rubripirellula reticaptiva]|nr:hypothetical protein [Rubripirellula reticaptiva]